MNTIESLEADYDRIWGQVELLKNMLVGIDTGIYSYVTRRGISDELALWESRLADARAHLHAAKPW